MGKLGIWVQNESQAPHKPRKNNVSSTFEVVPSSPKSG